MKIVLLAQSPLLHYVQRMFSLLLTLLITWASFGSAEEKEKSAFELALEQNGYLETQERWTYADGIKYREVIYQGEVFLVKFKEGEDGSGSLRCGLKNHSATPHRIEVATRVTKRTSAFIRLLREKCANRNGRDITEFEFDPSIGVALPDSPKDAIKNKKIFFNPTQGLNFSGEW